MSTSFMKDLFDTLDILVLERLQDGSFRRMGGVPDWFRRLCSNVDGDQIALRLGEEFPFLENFLIDAEGFWMQTARGYLKSGPWVEMDASRQELPLEATAVSCGKTKLLMIELIRHLYNEQQSILQKGRELRLDYIHLDQLEKALRKANHKLLELDDLKNRFLGMAAHDLRNPLVSIGGVCELFLEGDFGPITEEQAEFLTIINKASDDMFNLVNELLDISVIESGKLDLDLKPGSLKTLIEERVRIHGVVADKKGTILHTALANIPEFIFDAHRIAQAFDNLISNAIKYSPPGSTVFLALEEKDRAAEFSIRDKGPGISVEEQSKLFGEFQRLSPQPTGEEKSTGLGLSITKKIVEAHGGTISVQSQVGAGSTFKIVLPPETTLAKTGGSN